MISSVIETVHIRYTVSKTFHITDKEIVLHVDTDNTPIVIPESYRADVILLAKRARQYADEYIKVVEINASGAAHPGELGDHAQRIWEELKS